MVELSTLPGLFAMAGLAFFSIAALVAVIVPVAAVAVLRRPRIAPRKVTLVAAGTGVGPGQSDSGARAVIKGGTAVLKAIVGSPRVGTERLPAGLTSKATTFPQRV